MQKRDLWLQTLHPSHSRAISLASQCIIAAAAFGLVPFFVFVADSTPGKVCGLKGSTHRLLGTRLSISVSRIGS